MGAPALAVPSEILESDRPVDLRVAPRPLAVDLDGTLTRTDVLHEMLLHLFFRRPWLLPRVLYKLRDGRAAFKSAATRASDVDCSALPFDEAVLALIAERRDAGGEVHLVTASDQQVADGVAAALPHFASATGSAGGRNLKGPAKAAELKRRFPDGCDYVGDAAADVPVWRQAGAAIVAGGSPALLRSLAGEGLETRVLPRRRATALDWVKALRLHQWSKNALVFVPLVLAQEFTDPALALRVVLAWVLFGVLASGTYLLNDLADLAADRAHPTKRRRPIAAGVIPISKAAPSAALLVAGGLVGGLLLHPGFGAVLTCYAALTLLYSFRLKREPLLDVATIAALFAVRILAGLAIVDRPVSLWLVTFTAVLFLSLALAKRTAELVRAERAGREIAGRGYVPADAPLTLALGVSAGTIAVVVMVIYMSVDAMPTGLYGSRGALFTIPAVLGLWIMRIWLLAHRGVLNEDPVVYAVRDPASWAHAASIAALWAFAVLAQ